MRNPLTIGELVEAIELEDAAQHSDAGERVPPFPRRVVQERRAPEGTSRPVSRPAIPGPQDEPMPTEQPRSPNRTWLAGCTVHQEPSVSHAASRRADRSSGKSPVHFNFGPHQRILAGAVIGRR